MNETLRQFTDSIALELKAKLSSPETAEYLSKMKAAGDDRSFEVVMSTADEDRQGDELDQSKWELKYYDLNPVVLWAHNYFGFPIGIVTDIKTEGNKTVATGKFAPEGVNPEADMACALYQEKILRAVSPGYIQNDDGTRELLELSFCPVPAGRYALTLRQVSKLGVSTRDLVTKGFFYDTKGAVPYADHGTANPDTAWDGPAEVKEAGEDLKKLKAMCAWFDSENADVKSSYKLPHHRASDLKAVWNGVKAAMGALKGSRGGVDIPESDKRAVYNHLAKHYKEFEKKPPDYEKAVKAEELGDSCEMEDGSPGVLAEDPKNPGHLVCVPSDEGKSKSTTKMDELKKNLKAEHERHADAVEKAIDEFKSEVEDAEEKSEHEKAIDEFGKALDGEHDKHLKAVYKAIDDNYELEDQDPSNKAKAIDEFKAEATREHGKHVKAMDGAMDEMKKDWPDGDPKEPETKKAAEKAIDEFRKKAEDELVRHAKAHEEMLKAEPQGDNDGDEKAVAEAIRKAGRAISAKNKEKLGTIVKALEDHHAEHEKFTKDAIAALKELIGSPEDDEGEDRQDEKSGAPNSRSSTSGAIADLETYLLTQRLVRQVKTAAENALRQLGPKIKEARSRS